MRWQEFNLPGSIIAPILWHHEPDKATHNKEMTHVCCLGDQIATILGTSHPDFPFVEPSILPSLDYLGIRQDHFQLILTYCLESVSRISPWTGPSRSCPLYYSLSLLPDH
ncbi:MAG: hypothetical protein ACYCRD_00710 [Leptospirillum sp.]